MNPTSLPDFFLWILFLQLLRRGFPLGIDEYAALRTALWAGFGWQSREDLCDLCVALWAKSQAEASVVRALFDQIAPEDWRLPCPQSPSTGPDAVIQPDQQPSKTTGKEEMPPMEEHLLTPPAGVRSDFGYLPPLPRQQISASAKDHVFLPQFPVNFRTVAQAWRQLRLRVREGPPTELDVHATIGNRSRRGVASPPVLRPRRRNRVRLLLLVDRQGSMTPFHPYVDEVCAAIHQAARIEDVDICYFHDVPLEGTDTAVLEALSGQLFPTLDTVLSQIEPLNRGFFYADPDLLSPLPAETVLAKYAGAATVIIGDAGAALGDYDLLRLLDTVAFCKALKEMGSRYVWLNPWPRQRWVNSTAAQIARHLPMFPLDWLGMHGAINVLRGQPAHVERPL